MPYSLFVLKYGLTVSPAGKVYSPQWFAPEALRKKAKEINNKAADMWSFAIVLWEMATREVPFADLSPMEAGMRVRNSLLVSSHELGGFTTSNLATQN